MKINHLSNFIISIRKDNRSLRVLVVRICNRYCTYELKKRNLSITFGKYQLVCPLPEIAGIGAETAEVNCLKLQFLDHNSKSYMVLEPKIRLSDNTYSQCLKAIDQHQWVIISIPHYFRISLFRLHEHIRADQFVRLSIRFSLFRLH